MDEKTAATVYATSITSLIVSVISLVGSIFINRISFKNSKAVDIHKYCLSLADDELKKSIIGLEEGIRVIQKIKDDITLYCNTLDKNSINDLLTAINKSREEIMLAFQKHNGSLSINDRNVFHQAKNLAVFIEKDINLAVTKSNSNRFSFSDFYRQLMKYKNELTEKQNVLRDSRSDKVINGSYNITINRDKA